MAALAAFAGLFAGCGGGASGPSPARFAAGATSVCSGVAPRVKRTSDAIAALDKSKLAALGGLLQDLDREFTDLHDGLAKLTAPARQKTAYAAFLGDLATLDGVIKGGIAALRPGSVNGAAQLQALATRLNSVDTTLSADAARVPGLNACNKLSG